MERLFEKRGKSSLGIYELVSIYKNDLLFGAGADSSQLGADSSQLVGADSSHRPLYFILMEL